MVTRICGICQTAFKTYPSLTKNGRGLYCSLPCKHIGTRRPREPLEARFWRMAIIPVDPQACWGWRGYQDKHGYAKIAVKIKDKWSYWGAHRVSDFIHNGPLPDGLEVLHNCPTGDNPTCSNFLHLWRGTQRQNMQDAGRKGQMPRGENHWNSKLTQYDILRIFHLTIFGSARSDIALLLHCHPQHVSYLKRKAGWKHLFTSSEAPCE